jgi:hypothetical protein
MPADVSWIVGVIVPVSGGIIYGRLRRHAVGQEATQAKAKAPDQDRW